MSMNETAQQKPVPIVILGGTGNGLVAAQVIKDMQRAGQAVEMLGFLNDHQGQGERIGGYPILGTTREWASLAEDVLFHCSLLGVGNVQARAALFESLEIPEERLATLIHPTTCIADDVVIGRGAMICSFVTCQPGARIGRLGSIRAGANIGHDATLGDYAYVGPNATLCGYATVGKGGYVAPNAVLRDRTEMGEYAVLAAGAVAFKDIEPHSTWIGNPARRAV